MGRSPCCSKEGLNRGAWTSWEDKTLAAYIKANGEGNWRNLPRKAGLKRCGKSCRLRWLNYLRPDIKRGNISPDEEDLIIRLHKLLGNRWSLIAGRLPGRTDNEIKNYWNTTLGKKAKSQLSSPPPPQDTTQPQIIRTKATRCNKVVVSAPDEVQLPKNHEDSYISSAEIEPQQEPDSFVKIDHIHEHEEFRHRSCNSGFLNFGQHNEFQGARDDAAGANNDFSSMDAHDQVLLMDEPLFGDWSADSCLKDHHNASLDLESLAFLLDSSEWA